MNFSIRDARPGDAGTIASFNSAMCEETEGRSLDPDMIGPGVVRLLADSQKGRYWVAERKGKIIGQIMVTYEWSDWRNGMLWWIQSVYIVPNARRQGVFSALYRHVVALAQDDPDAAGLRLYYEKDNDKARATYEKLGMIDPGYRVMEAIFNKGN